MTDEPEHEPCGVVMATCVNDQGHPGAHWNPRVEDENGVIPLRPPWVVDASSDYLAASRDADREGLHQLLVPPHPGGLYLSSALCSCGEWQYDESSEPALRGAQREVRRSHAAHVRAAGSDREGEPG